jgi:hypothetical protein
MDCEKLINDYKAELTHARQMRSWGITVVPADQARTESPISIDEYIKKWVDDVIALENGADIKDY